ncbi:MAG: hypothetical protein AAB973_01880 [Patescibacteria group bacterium]
MRLYLDSTDNKKVIIRLDAEEFINEYDSPREQDVLFFLNGLLEKKNLSLDDLSEIEVNPGPGSFTGSRVGVAIANALAFALKIKVNGQEPPILPVYSSPPNINV